MDTQTPTTTPTTPQTRPSQERTIESPYLDLNEAAAYCRCAKKTILNHRREIERQPGIGKLIFKRETLDKWLATRRRG